MLTFYLAFRNLFRNIRRTIAILLTVALGAGALFSFEGFIRGVLDDYKESTIHAHYGHGQINMKGYREQVFQEPWKHWIQNAPEVETFLEGQEGVAYVFPRVSFSALLKRDGVTMGGFGQGIEAQKESLFFHSLNIEVGVPLTDQEKGILMGKGLASSLHATVGDTVSLMVNATDGSVVTSDFVVTGIFHTGSFDFDSKMFRIQLPQAQKILKTSRIETFSLGLSDETKWQEIVKEVSQKYPQFEATSFDILDEIYYKHSVEWLNTQFHVVQIIILAIVLLGIFNTISTSILERKQEIGNLRANGESILDVMKLLITEGSLLGILGGTLGMGVSYFILTTFLDHGILMPPGPGLTRQFYIVFKFDWSMVMATFSLSLLSATMAAFLASFRVARMPIAQALRAV